MNSVIPSNPLFAPHLLENPRHSPSRSDLYPPQTMSGRKRKASSEPDDRMSTSPTSSPSVPSRTLPIPLQPRSKRHRTASTAGRPLDLPRLLETLSPTDLRTLLTQLCTSHPSLTSEVTSLAPRPSLDSVLALLRTYESTFKSSFPFGNRPGSDYTYNRVRASLTALLGAISDFTPQFLPPAETQLSVSLSFLDAATEMLHRVPDFDTYSHNAARQEAYEEMSGAWATVVREAMKRGGGIQLQFGGWDGKVARHDQISGGRMRGAVEEMQKGLGWMGREARTGMGVGGDERAQIRQQLLSGTYGQGVGVGGSQW